MLEYFHSICSWLLHPRHNNNQKNSLDISTYILKKEKKINVRMIHINVLLFKHVYSGNVLYL